tara:strand:+ start:202 stop:858 length:657 start_codon:yes stop_codon:yes gene_type:complete
MDLDLIQLQKKEINLKSKQEKITYFSNKFLETYMNFSKDKKKYIKKYINNKSYQKKIILEFKKFSKDISKEDSILLGNIIIKLLKLLSKNNVKLVQNSQKNKVEEISPTTNQFHEICMKIKEHYNDLILLLQKDAQEYTTLVMTTNDCLMNGKLSQKKLIITRKESLTELIYLIDFEKKIIKKKSALLTVNEIPKFELTYKKFAEYLANKKIKYAIKK